MDESIVRKKSDIWECVKRVDSYLNASNFKTALIFTFTFALSASLYGRWENVLGGKGGAIVGCEFYVLMSAFFVAVMVTGFFALLAVYPQTGKSDINSIYYFPGMQEKSASRVFDDFLSMSEEDEIRLIYQQYVELSKLARRKFSYHKKAIIFSIIQLLFGMLFYAYSFAV